MYKNINSILPRLSYDKKSGFISKLKLFCFLILVMVLFSSCSTEEKKDELTILETQLKEITFFNSDNPDIIMAKNTLAYNDKGELIEIIKYEQNDNNQELDKIRTFTCEYFENSEIDFCVSKSSNGYFKTDHTLNDKELIIKTVHEEKIKEDDSWTTSLTETYTYDDNDKLIKSEIFYDDMPLHYKSIYQYDSQGRLLSEIEYKKNVDDANNEEWEEVSKIIMNYDETDNKIHESHQYKSQDTGEFIEENRTEYILDNNDKIKEVFYYNQDPKPFKKETTSYSSNGKTITTATQKWDNENNKFVETEEIAFEFNDSGNLDKIKSIQKDKNSNIIENIEIILAWDDKDSNLSYLHSGELQLKPRWKSLKQESVGQLFFIFIKLAF